MTGISCKKNNLDGSMPNPFHPKPPFDNWDSSVTFLNQLTEIAEPMRMQLLGQVFKSVDLNSFTVTERDIFAERLKHFRDMRSVLETAWDDGRWQARQKSVKGLLQTGLSVSEVAQILKLTETEVQQMRDRSFRPLGS